MVNQVTRLFHHMLQKAYLSGVIANMANQVISGVDETTLPNANLGWEHSGQYNVGLDAAFANRFNFFHERLPA